MLCEAQLPRRLTSLEKVLILVLMEDALRGALLGWIEPGQEAVLILVLMEDALRETREVH